MRGDNGGPLDGVRVVDLTRVLAGPFCSMVLADLGAEVIKVEYPGRGDDARAFGPHVQGESTYFMSLNRNKKGITLNLKKPAGKGILQSLVKKADILLENFRPGTMEALGLGYEELARVNPKLIYASCSGFGQTGPLRDRPAYDLIVQAMGGIMSLTGAPGGPPTRVGSSIGDITAGLFTAIGVLAALQARERTGRGQKVDVSMLDCQVAILENAITRYLVTGELPTRVGNRHPSITPFAVFPGSDGYFIVAAGNDTLWEKLCRVIGREDLLGNPLFATNASRTENHQELLEALEGTFSTKSTGYWLERLQEAGIPCGPILGVDEVCRHPQVLAREMIVELDHPKAGRIKVPGCPVKFSETNRTTTDPAPTLGQHNREVLGGILGLKPGEIENLERDGVVSFS